MTPRDVSSAVVALLVVVASPALGGCGLVEANVQAIDTLARDDAGEGDKAWSTVVVAGTTTALIGLALAASIAGIEIDGDDPEPPRFEIVDELGWGYTRRDGVARWYRCTSRLLCTQVEVVEDASAVLRVVPAGRGQPMALDGALGGEVDLVTIRVRRRR